jgi:hypothetical protein
LEPVIQKLRLEKSYSFFLFNYLLRPKLDAVQITLFAHTICPPF